MNSKKEFLNICIIFILSLIFVSDLFIQKYQPQTFDEPTHATTIALFRNILKQGEFPIIWVDKFANNGYPLGLFTQQTIAYFGGFIDLIFNNPVFSYNLLVFAGSFFSTLFFYYFLRNYFDEKISLVSSTLLNFSAYKIIDIYIRGALPEYFSFAFFVLALLSIHKIFIKRKTIFISILIIALTLILLTHPMMFVLYAPIICLYFFFIWKELKYSIKILFIFIFSLILAFLLSAYYLIPLKLENKYFAMGDQASSINKEQFLNFKNYFSSNWYYFLSHPGPRGNFIKFGLIESLLLLSSIIILKFYKKIEKSNKNLFLFSTISTLILIFLTTKLSLSFYQLPFLREIQYSWRVLGVLIIFPPIFLAFILNKFKNNFVYLFFVIIILLARIPQLFTKNIVNFPKDRYEFTAYNLHIKDLTLNWIGEPSQYPIKKNKVEIIEGSGEINNLIIKNSSRSFVLTANTNTRLLDNTFYYPGWTVYVDNQKTNIEYQDPNYRGMITYKVSPGNHQIKVVFENTKIRKYSQLISLLSSLIFISTMVFRKKIFKIN